MATETLATWAEKFLKALSKYQTEINQFSKARSFDTRFGGRSRRSTATIDTARTKLVNICNELSSVLTSSNKAIILSSLEIIVSKVNATNFNQDKIPSYYSEFTNWFTTYIKPLI
jgi:hypothetical protein